jgi:hypothetical protein
MEDLTTALAGIETALKGLRRHVLLRALKEGLEAGHTRSLLQGFGLPSSGEVQALYAWKNGTQTMGVESLDDIHLFPGFYFLSLEDAIANYGAFVGDARWTPGWLPVFANGGGDFYVTDLSGDLPGVVRHFRIEESEHPIEFVSVVDMLKTIAAGFERKVFFVDPNGYLDMDDLAFATVAGELNPRVPWWVD